jgi:hypothetical protein
MTYRLLDVLRILQLIITCAAFEHHMFQISRSVSQRDEECSESESFYVRSETADNTGLFDQVTKGDCARNRSEHDRNNRENKTL